MADCVDKYEKLDMRRELMRLHELPELDPQHIEYARGYIVDQVKRIEAAV